MHLNAGLSKGFEIVAQALRFDIPKPIGCAIIIMRPFQPCAETLNGAVSDHFDQRKTQLVAIAGLQFLHARHAFCGFHSISLKSHDKAHGEIFGINRFAHGVFTARRNRVDQIGCSGDAGLACHIGEIDQCFRR